MGRKGGRKGFAFKSTQRPTDNKEEEQEEEEPQQLVKQQIVAESGDKQVGGDTGSSSSVKKAVEEEQEELNPQFLKGAEEDEEEDEKDEGGETRGRMIQRHKKEQKQVKEQMKRLGKKKKDEAQKLENDLLSKQQKELQEFDSRQDNGEKSDTVNEVQNSLYAFKLGDSEPTQKKLSKGQKRRQKLAEQEAEREAQIKEELDNLGTTQRMAESEKLEEILNPLGLTVFDVKPDGHCMYRALAHQLQGTAFEELRVEAAAYVRKHKDEYLPFILGELEDEEAAEKDPDAAFQNYCHQLENTPAWGGQVEATAVSHQLKRCIKIYSADAPVVVIGSEYQINGDVLHICYKKHAFGLGEHYDSVAELQKEGQKDEGEEEDEKD